MGYGAAMTRSVICVSHEPGAGGRELARMVAETLGYRYVDEEIMAKAAADEGVTVEELADVERRKSFFSRLMTDFGQSGAGMYGPTIIPPEVVLRTPDSLRSAITTAIEDLASQGKTVIVSHAASHALSGDHVLRVLVVAPDGVRCSRIAIDLELDERDAAKQMADGDAGRRDYLKRFYRIDREAADQYDIVVNTGSLALEALAKLVVAAAEL